MKIDILTLFPGMFDSLLGESIVKKAQERELLEINTHDFRDFANDKHNKVDDYPYGGGAGMLLQVGPIDRTLKSIGGAPHVVLLDPTGRKFDQKVAEELAEEKELVLICGHYEGYDERIRELVDEEVSIGDFVLTGGELGAAVMIDAVSRLIPGVLGNEDSAVTDSHSSGLLEHPQYTRPEDYDGKLVPEVLLSGNHAKIKEWQTKESLRKTLERRPELLENYKFNTLEEKLYNELLAELPKPEKEREFDSPAIREFWAEHSPEPDADYIAEPFGATGLWQIVLEGKKTATSSLEILYKYDEVPEPYVGSYYVTLDDELNPVAITQTTEVRKYKFKDATPEIGLLEGEGDLTLSYWRRAHKNIFRKWLKEDYDYKFHDDLVVVTEIFKVVYAIPNVQK
jgi:tRNA (guanine37-N1)-methyltransferase